MPESRSNFKPVRSKFLPERWDHHNCLRVLTAKVWLRGCVVNAMSFLQWRSTHEQMVKPVTHVKTQLVSSVSWELSEGIELYFLISWCERSVWSSDKTHHRQTRYFRQRCLHFLFFSVEEVINWVILGIIFFLKGKSLFWTKLFYFPMLLFGKQND